MALMKSQASKRVRFQPFPSSTNDRMKPFSHLFIDPSTIDIMMELSGTLEQLDYEYPDLFTEGGDEPETDDDEADSDDEVDSNEVETEEEEQEEPDLRSHHAKLKNFLENDLTGYRSTKRPRANLVDSTNNGQYRVEKSIGKGAFGMVFKAIDLRAARSRKQQIVAIKIISLSQNLNSAKQEIEVLKALKHQNIVSYFSSYSFKHKDGSDGISIVMEYCCNGSLMEHLALLSHTSQELPVRKRIEWYKQLTSAIAYIHEKGIAHRDIKPENILLAENNVVKVADVGIAKAVWECGSSSHSSLHQSLGHFLTSMKGTRPYMAPEVYSNERYGIQCDVFSLGLVFWMMIALPPRYPEVKLGYGCKYLGELLSRRSYMSYRLKPTDYLSIQVTCSPAESNMISKMLHGNPEQRITMSAVVKYIQTKLYIK